MKKGMKVCLIFGISCLILGTAISTAALAMGADPFWNSSYISRSIRWNGSDDGRELTAFRDEASFQDVTSLTIDCAAGEILYQVGDYEQITVRAEEEDRYSWKIDGTTLKIDSRHKRYVNDRGLLVIEVPEGYVWKDFKLEMSAGSFYAKTLTADKADIEIKAGSVEIKGGQIGELSAEVAAGYLECKAAVMNDAKLDCAAGDLSVWMGRLQKDYDVKIDCKMGEVQVGSLNFSAMKGKKNIDNDAERELKIDCKTGAVSVYFTE